MAPRSATGRRYFTKIAGNYMTDSLWTEVSLPPFPNLKTNQKADICIVGAGIVGLTCGYRLAKLGKSVIVLDQNTTVQGETARTTAHLTWMLDDRFFHLEKLFGLKKTKLAAESHAAAIDTIEKIIQDEQIDCDFERVNGYLFTPPKSSHDILDREFETLYKIGMPVTQKTRVPFGTAFDTGPCLHLPNQAQLHILLYLKGLMKAIKKYGGHIFGAAHVDQIQDDHPCVVHTRSKKRVEADAVIVATCTPINNRFIIHTKQAAYRTYALAAPIEHGSVKKGLYWDTATPYHYVRIQKHSSNPNVDWLIVGGEDHRTGQNKGVTQHARLEKWAKQRFPHMGEVAYRWSGQIFEPVDSLAFIGRNPGDKNIYIASGDSGNGLTHGTIAGILIPDLIFEKNNPWEELYQPSRKTLSACPKFVHENLNTALQYRDWLTPGENKQIALLKADDGMILRKGQKKISIYKDKQNQVHVNSAYCPHLGGCVRWNAGEKTWDCPCHGSRFSGEGEVITGPAISNLPPCHLEE
jgi:glycine/D-amino acid oxidase-like deaminating enzyme/nitrite reductase/ring-hydroxylating ferredoxin subunit